MPGINWSPPDLGVDLSGSSCINPRQEPLAVIGLACRFAGDASDSQKLWQMLLEQRSAAGPVPKSRFDASSYYHPDPDHGGTSAAKGGYFLEGDIHALDTSLFNLTASEVASMDPQQKLLLENVFHALENAGLPLDKMAGSRTSVFIGASNNDHLALANTDMEMLQKHRATGTSPSILSNRVSWFYDLRGTSQTIDTACSSSLVGFHQACTNLQSGQSDMSIVSGVNLIEHPASSMQLSTLGVLSPDGKCFSFDHRANGYGRGEGVGTVILKPLSAALRDGDTVRAIVRGTGSNQDGKTPGMSLPSPDAQEALIKQVYASAGLDMGDTSYIEAHGTGTPVGDPLEVQAISNAFQIAERAKPLHIGSVKANLGHLEGGAGIAGLIKVILMLETQIIPGLANFEQLNPKLQGRSNLAFQTTPKIWPEEDRIRRASINSFGFGGTNSHAVLEAADSLLNRATEWQREESTFSITRTPPHGTNGIKHDLDLAQPTALMRTPESIDHTDPLDAALGQKYGTDISNALVFILSASDQPGLVRNAKALKEHLDPLVRSKDKSAQARYLIDLAYTLSCHRSSLRWKTFHVANSVEELLRGLDTDSPLALRAKSRAYRVGFVFTGQGAQWSKMGSSLLIYTTFRKSVEEASLFLSGLGCPYNVQEIFENGSQDINHPLLSQTMCTVLQVALVDLLASWNVFPCVTVGHSSGEICAAYSARRLTRQAAWKIAYYRGVVSVTLHERDRGGMLAVGASIDTVVEQMRALEHEFQNSPEIGCFNSPKNVTVTGDRVELQKLQSALDQNHIFNRMLPVKVPYHSQQMRAVAVKYESLLGDLSRGEKLASTQEVRMVSSLTGSTMVKRKLDDASYWVDNLVSPVRFSDALLNSCLAPLSAEGSPMASVDGLVELGPHSTMRSAIREGLGSFSSLKAIEYSHAITRKEDSNRSLLGMVATLNSRGYPVNIDTVNQCSRPHLHNRKMAPNLPPYSFHHEKSSRTETRLIKNLRFPRYARHELLGSPVVDWNDYEPKWRNFLRTSEMPWTRHNQLSGNNIFPGVASLIMAMEAAGRLIDAPVKPSGYRVRNVSYKAALLIPETKEGIEISFSMRRTNDISDDHQPWYEFYMRSHDSERDCWVEHSSGLVRVESETQHNELDDAALSVCNNQSLKSWTAALERCTQAMDVQDYYRKLKSSGVLFGPTMQNLTEMAISKSEDEIFGKVQVPSLSDNTAAGHAKPLTIHPTTMESLAQILLPICVSRESPLGSELLTTFTEEIWVSASIDSNPGNLFQARSWSTPRGVSQWRADMDVWNTTQERQITATGMMLSALSQHKEVSPEYSVCYKVSARLSTDLLVSAADFQALHQDKLKPKDTANLEQMEILSASFILETVDKLKSLPEAVMPQYQKFYNWMLETASAVESGTVPLVLPTAVSSLNQDRDRRGKLQDSLAASSKRGAALVEVGQRLASILTGEETISSLEDVLNGARQDVSWGNIEPLFSQYLVALGQNHSNIKVLELGAGAGDATEQVLEALGSSISRYHFTDANDAFFEEVQHKFSNWSQKMDYSVLELGVDETDDNFQAGSYDLVVAAHGFAASDAQVALNRMRSLLKPGGKMLLIESANLNLMSLSISSGVYPEWWEQAHPNEQETNMLLPQSGFCQDSLIFHDTDEENAQQMTLFISTAADTEAKPNGEINEGRRKCFVVSSRHGGLAVEVGSLLGDELADTAVEVTVVDAQHLREHDLQDSICVVVLGLDSFDLSTISSDDYDSLKYMLQTCRGLIWVTDDTLSSPLASMAIGMIRTARSERHSENVNLITLGFGSSQPAPRLMSETVGRLFRSSFEGSHTLEGNGEYTFQDGLFWINKLHAATDVNQFLESRFAPQPTTEPLGVNLDKPLKLEIKQPGDLHSFEFALDPSQSIPLLDDHVQIQVESWGLGSIGTTSTLGKDIENRLGREAAGRVARVGAAVKNLAVGDRVMAFSPSAALGTSLIAPSKSAQVIPPTADFTQAAGIPFCFCTAFYSLCEVAKLQQGETILIQSAASGVGQAAVQLARLAKADILAMVWTIEEKNILVEKYGLEDHQIFYGGTGTIQAIIDAATGGRGVDVVLRTRATIASDAVSDAAWRCMAPFGRFLDLVTHDSSFRAKLDMLPFSRAAMYASIDIMKMAKDKPERIWTLLQETANLYQKGNIECPEPRAQFNFSEIESAVSYAGQGNVLGAAVLAPRIEDMVPKRSSPLPAYRFPGNVSYVLAGGLGGLGRSIARWMASRGARYFIFFSRSGAQGESTTGFLQELRHRGCGVEVGTCDISNLDVLAKTLDSYRSSMPPIKGCFQCSMVLRDAMLSNMSHAQFVDCITPKVQGSANLAQVLPRDLDFLLLLSSSSAIIGNRGQANYSAANMYMDTLAESLVRDGFPAISLNLGSVLSAGWLAENKDSKLTGALSHLTTSEEELLALIEYHIDPRYNAVGSVETCHTVTGLRNAAYFSRLGIPQPEFFEYPLFSQLRTLPPAADGSGRDLDADISIKEQLQSPETDPGTIPERISSAIARKLSAMMSIPEEDFEYNRPLTSYGVDSLVTLDFRGWIVSTFAATVSVLDLLNGNSIDGLSRKIAESMGLLLQ